MEFLKDLRYGKHERNILDIAFPDELKPEMGLVMVIHGGAFITGDKSMYAEDIKKFQSMGAVFAATNYRYASEIVSLKEIIDDITSAVKYVKEKCAEKGVTLNGMITTGGSAGGHLSLYYAYTMKEKSPVPVKAVVSFCAPADMASEEIRDIYYYNNFLGDGKPDFIFGFTSNLCKYKIGSENLDTPEAQEKLKSISPLYFIDESSVPSAIVHGNADNLVPYVNAVRLDKALNKAGVPHDFVTIEDGGHALMENETCLKEREKLLDKYIKTYLL